MMRRPAVQFRRVIVPIDFREDSLDVLAYAMRLSKGHDAELVVFHAHPLGASSTDVAATSERMEHSVDAAAQRAGWDREQRAAVNLRLSPGSPSEAIVTAASDADADLTIMATRGGSLLMGSVAEQVVMKSRGSVMVLHRDRGLDWPPQGPVIAAVDFSPASRRALQFASALAGETAPVEVVHVQPDRDGDDALVPDDKVRSRLERFAPMPVDAVHLRRGDYAPRILEVTAEREASLLVAGTHGREGRDSLLVGGVARRLIRSAPAPLLMVR